MFWWRHVLLRPLWSHNVGLGSLLFGLYGRSLCFASLLDGVLVDHPASQTCSLERFMILALGTLSGVPETLVIHKLIAIKYSAPHVT
jgi:hypothetical protein